MMNLFKGPKRIWFGLWALVLWGVLGCENTVDETPNNLPGEMSGDTGCDGAAAFCGCDEPGAIYRLTQLELASLAGDENHPIVPLLNGNWANDIAKKEINIYLEVISSGRREMTMRVVSGLRATPVEGDAMSFDFGEAETCILPETGVKFLAGPMENGGYENQTSTAFNVAPGTPNERKICASDIPTPHTIPVRNLKLQAKFTQDCSQMIEGVALSGSLPADEVDRICMCQRIGGTAEDCEPLDPDFESDHGRCNTCNVNYESLGFLMTALNGGVKLPAECEADPDVSEAGDELSIPGICITGRLVAGRRAEGPPPCPV